MAETCRQGLHPYEPGECRECRRASWAAAARRYRASPHGGPRNRATQARYKQTLNGQLNRIESEIRRRLAAQTTGGTTPA